MSTAAPALAGRVVLLAEDDYFIMSMLKRSLEAQGAEVVGPASGVERALGLATSTPRLDAAVLDINLQGEMAFPVADALRARDVPFLFTTGYDEAVIPAHLRNTVTCEKPVRPEDVVRAVAALTDRG